MRYFLLTATAVLTCSSLAVADDLPPVPKKATTTQVEATAIVVKKPMPSAGGMVENAPLPSACGKADTASEEPSCKAKCHCRPSVGPVKFLANELLRKPIHGVEKVMNDAEGCRIRREQCRVDHEAEQIACEAERLTEKVRQTCPHDVHAKFKLLREECDLAQDANRNTLGRARLECRQSEYCREKARLDARQAELYPARD